MEEQEEEEETKKMTRGEERGFFFFFFVCCFIGAKTRKKMRWTPRHVLGFVFLVTGEAPAGAAAPGGSLHGARQ